MNDKHFPPESIERLRSEKRIHFLKPQILVEKCLELSAIRTGNVLEIGTGSGLFAEIFMKKGFSVTGIDDTNQMISEAKRLVPSATFLQCSAEKLPFPDKTFDIVFMAQVFHEVDSREKSLLEAIRVTKHNIFIIEWIYQNEEMGPPLSHRLKPEEMKQLFQKAGLKNSRFMPIENMFLYCSEI